MRRLYTVIVTQNFLTYHGLHKALSTKTQLYMPAIYPIVYLWVQGEGDADCSLEPHDCEVLLAHIRFRKAFLTASMQLDKGGTAVNQAKKQLVRLNHKP